ncbi:MAG: hypothetical protein AAF500_16430 [Myxococcota bacterium]
MTNLIQRQRDLERFIGHALEASVYVSPSEHGLAEAELIEVGGRHGFGPGEILDCAASARSQMLEFDGARIVLSVASSMYLVDFNWTWPDDPRSWKAQDFMLREFEQLRRDHGATGAKVEHAVLVERGKADGHTQKDMEVAIASYELHGLLSRDQDAILSRTNRTYLPPAEQIKQHKRVPQRQSYPSKDLMATVADVISRRDSVRPRHAEPLDEYGELLERTSNARYRIWWEQARSELRCSSPQTMPTSTLVLAAALAEGSLALIADDVRTTGETMGTKTLQDTPNRWKFTDLIDGAKRGKRPIIDQKLSDRCGQLNDERQRIHAGNFLHKKVAPRKIDIRPEEAKRARETLDDLLRAILDWFAEKSAD